MSRGKSDPKELRQEIEQRMGELRDKIATSQPALPKLLAKLAARISEGHRGQMRRSSDGSENIVTHLDNHFFLYKPATVVRLPTTTGTETATTPDFEMRIQRDKPEDDVALDARQFGLDEGFYILKDGTGVIRVPNDGSKIECFVEGNKGTVADDGFNYKC